ncbi:MAG: hypothetical protein RLZZ59_508 [Pseudomonadota bacterium]|jgi:anhydro-N-acetylmuramic acid kinase
MVIRMNKKIAIGLMSGTSMDGIDAAIIETDGERYIRELSNISTEYTKQTQSQFKNFEEKVRNANGTLPPNNETSEIITLSTNLHIEAVNLLLETYKYSPKDIDVIGYHGQTIYHQPQNSISIILGDGSRMAKELGIKVVSDFRSNDIKNGGQGAPFAPLYHRALALRDKLTPCVVVNCGGISNITIIPTENLEDLIAFDTGPGNGLIDKMVKEFSKGLENMDLFGKYGMNGKVHENLIELLYAKSITKNGKNFFNMPLPKSLDIGDMKIPNEFFEISIEDSCRTLEAFTADSIIRSANLFNKPLPQKWILSGGGWNNPVILSELKIKLEKYNAIASIADEIGWNSKALEAQIFAYLAVRSLDKKPLSIPSTTGVKAPITGGIIHNP